MKITVRNLYQKNFIIHIEPTKTVKDLKQQIEAEKGKEYRWDYQKLIYRGKILKDETPLSEYSIDEDKFIVIMVSKPDSTEVANSGDSTSTTTTTTQPRLVETSLKSDVLTDFSQCDACPRAGPGPGGARSCSRYCPCCARPAGDELQQRGRIGPAHGRRVREHGTKHRRHGIPARSGGAGAQSQLQQPGSGC
jgi:hypothetical protein